MDTGGKKKITVAICYDFDKTLSPDDMQSQGFIQSLGFSEVQEFWKESNDLSENNDMDHILAYMYMMAIKSRGKNVFNKQILMDAGKKIAFFPGVEEWFNRINNYGRVRGIEVQHFIISSGLKEMIEGTSIGKEFHEIYASSFHYDEYGVAVWPAQVVNYTNKTQFLFRIEKGALGVNDSKINDFVKPEDYVVPFRNMVYIGDSDTDIPCMKLVNTKGGYSIGVYDPDKNDRSKVFKMLNDSRIKYFVPADYREESALDRLVKEIIDRTEDNEKLVGFHNECLHEMQTAEIGKSNDDKAKENLINKLEDSDSFRTTHRIIQELASYKDWTDLQRNKLIHIALSNHQVTYILGDPDVKEFFKDICNGLGDNKGEEVKELLQLMKE